MTLPQRGLPLVDWRLSPGFPMFPCRVDAHYNDSRFQKFGPIEDVDLLFMLIEADDEQNLVYRWDLSHYTAITCMTDMHCTKEGQLALNYAH